MSCLGAIFNRTTKTPVLTFCSNELELALLAFGLDNLVVEILTVVCESAKFQIMCTGGQMIGWWAIPLFHLSQIKSSDRLFVGLFLPVIKHLVNPFSCVLGGNFNKYSPKATLRHGLQSWLEAAMSLNAGHVISLFRGFKFQSSFLSHITKCVLMDGANFLKCADSAQWTFWDGRFEHIARAESHSVRCYQNWNEALFCRAVRDGLLSQDILLMARSGYQHWWYQNGLLLHLAQSGMTCIQLPLLTPI